jgi:hypothetical protein
VSDAKEATFLKPTQGRKHEPLDPLVNLRTAKAHGLTIPESFLLLVARLPNYFCPASTLLRSVRSPEPKIGRV